MESREERKLQAAQGGLAEIKQLVHDPSVEVLEALLENPALSEEHLLLVLQRRDLPGEFLEALAKNRKLTDSQRVKAALVGNPKTPRLAALRFLRFLYLFDLVRVSLQPAVHTEVKRLAEDQIISRLEQLPVGQQVSLARRASGRVAAALVATGRAPVLEPALNNPFLTEAEILRVLRGEKMPAAVLAAIAGHPKWSRRYDIRLRLVRHPLTRRETALAILSSLKPEDLRLLSADRRINAGVRERIQAELERRRPGRHVSRWKGEGV